MSMHPQPIQAIPEETVRVAHTVLPEGNVWMQMRDELGTLFEDLFLGPLRVPEPFAGSRRGAPPVRPIAGSLPQAWLAQGAGPTTDRFDARAGGNSHAPSAGVCGRDHASCP